MPHITTDKTLDLLTDRFVFPEIFEVHRRTTPHPELIVVPYDGGETSPGYLRVSQNGHASYINEPFERGKSVLGARPLKAHQSEWRDVDRVERPEALRTRVLGELRLLEQVTI